MKTKIYIGNRYQGKFTCDGKIVTVWQSIKYRIIRTTKRVMLVMSIFCIMGWSVYAGSAYIPRTVFAERLVEIPVETIPPVMQRIAKCESGNTHFKNGQVLVQLNSNGTYDTGRYQINSIWNKKAHELGYNLSLEKDNEAFAMWLYNNYGSEPWSASRSNCWNK